MRPLAKAAIPDALPSLAAAASRMAVFRIVDVRDTDAFAAGHLPAAGQCTTAMFGERRMELPSRLVPVVTVHDDPAQARAAADRLALLGFERIGWLDRALGDEPEGHASREPATRLWSPSRFLEGVLPVLPRGRALDLACGSGRAAVHLALAGFAVEAWDLDATALERADAFAARNGVRLATRICDLESGPPALPEPRFDVVVVMRYLHRPLFPWLEQAIAPGGALVYETFRRGQEHFGHPRRDRHLLEPDELRTAFPGLHVEIHEQDSAATPPVMARLLARKPWPPAQG